jgi:hypothetical protein
MGGCADDGDSFVADPDDRGEQGGFPVRVARAVSYLARHGRDDANLRQCLCRLRRVQSDPALFLRQFHQLGEVNDRG